MKNAKTRKDPVFHSDANRLKSEFVGLASHQLRTPLTTINWYVEMLRSGDAGKLTPKQKQALKKVDAEARTMVKLVNEMFSPNRTKNSCVVVCGPTRRRQTTPRRLRHANR